jgi:hypothetical protein
MKESQASNQPIYRKAGHDDVVFISRLTREFYGKVGDIYHVPYSHASMIVTVDDIVDRGIVLVGPNSCAGAFFYPFPSNADFKMAHVLFWTFQRRREIGIFLELLKQVKEMGAVGVTCASHFPQNTIGRFYKKCGLKPVETHYMGQFA